DEPTNHLDMLSVSILVQALQQFEGTFLLVSHDRDFIANVANKIWWIEDQQIKEYPGTYEEWHWWYSKEQEKKKPVETADTKKEKKESVNTKPRHDQPQKELEKEIAQTESKIESLETEIANLESEMAKPEVYEDDQKMSKTTNKYNSKKAELEKLHTKWEELVEKMG
ncbi:MAG TPA: ABC transporter ATP-binding protein, partial [Cytophagales bacterium]|nr:ABC transporter ATP-binding protein [Cytophagales bacterium]